MRKKIEIKKQQQKKCMNDVKWKKMEYKIALKHVKELNVKLHGW